MKPYATTLLCFMVFLILFPPSRTQASYSIYVGKNHTGDGSVFLGGYGDEPSSHWLEIVPAKTYGPGETITVGVTSKATYPGGQFEIPQVARTNKYITVNYSAFAGFPAPLTNGGMNEYHVAARAVWSPSRDELRKMTPNPQKGLNYSDLSRIVMERAKTAREAVEIVGSLIDTYGYATYGGNPHMFADPNEGWILIDFAGGKGLWVAERLGPDAIRVSRPGYIGDIPLDYKKHPDYMGSDNLISFAVEQGWYDPSSGKPFNVNAVYGDRNFRQEAVIMMEERLVKRSPHVTLQDVIGAVRAPELTRDWAGYGQVAHLRSGIHRELGVLWIAASSPATAPFIPYPLGVTDVPPEFKKHRYLTEGEAAAFQDPDYVGIESTKYAFRIFKRLYYLTAEPPDKFLPGILEAFEGMEKMLIMKMETVEQTALALYNAEEAGLAREYLTYFSMTESMEGLRLGEALAAGIEAQTKAIYGIRKPSGIKMDGPVDLK